MARSFSAAPPSSTLHDSSTSSVCESSYARSLLSSSRCRMDVIEMHDVKKRIIAMLLPVNESAKCDDRVAEAVGQGCVV